MQPTVTPTNATVGAVLTDVDLANLDDATGRVVENAFHDFGALIFPNQHLTEEAQIAFAKRFGDLELLTPDDTMKAVSISNQKENGSVYDPEDFRYKTLRGNEGWHTDSSYMPLAAKVSILSAQVVPEEGGETEVADMRAAYDELSDSMKDRVSGL